MKLDVPISIVAVTVTLALIAAGLLVTDLILTRIEWDRHGSVQRARAEIEFPDLAPRDQNSLSRTFNLARMRFDLDAEISIPTWYTSALLGGAASLALVSGLKARELRRPAWGGWLLVAVGLAFLSMDEAAQIHELLNGEDSIGAQLNDVVGLDFIKFEWVIPAAAGVVVGLPLLIPFLLRLPRRTLALFVLAGLVYLSGAFGLETYQGEYIETHPIDGWGYHVLSATEETVEMAGVVILITAVLLHFRDHLSPASLVAGSRDRVASVEAPSPQPSSRPEHANPR